MTVNPANVARAYIRLDTARLTFDDSISRRSAIGSRSITNGEQTANRRREDNGRDKSPRLPPRLTDDRIVAAWITVSCNHPPHGIREPTDAPCCSERANKSSVAAWRVNLPGVASHRPVTVKRYNSRTGYQWPL